MPRRSLRRRGRLRPRWLHLPRTFLLCSVTAGLSCAAPPPEQPAPLTPSYPPVRLETVRSELSVLADDSMQGRGAGTPGGQRAARFIARVMREVGLAPAGSAQAVKAALAAAAEGGTGADIVAYFQRMPATRSGRRVRLLSDWSAFDRRPAADRVELANVVGILPGADSVLRAEAVVVDAHYDHLGIGAPVAGDSIFNGADDDASGVVAVLEIARTLAAGPRPRRSIVFLATTGEEVGMLGTSWYLAHPVVPLAHTVANLELEMIGRPDALAGGVGYAWLSGFDRSTMGQSFRRAGLAIVPDPHSGQQFWQRSDNIAFAEAGVPAHALSSFGLHSDYHERSDELATIDLAHMTAVIGTAVRAVQLLADGPAPRWYAGGRPAPSFR